VSSRYLTILLYCLLSNCSYEVSYLINQAAILMLFWCTSYWHGTWLGIMCQKVYELTIKKYYYQYSVYSINVEYLKANSMCFAMNLYAELHFCIEGTWRILCKMNVLYFVNVDRWWYSYVVVYVWSWCYTYIILGLYKYITQYMVLQVLNKTLTPASNHSQSFFVKCQLMLPAGYIPHKCKFMDRAQVEIGWMYTHC
jgi:hypothetical protein